MQIPHDGGLKHILLYINISQILIKYNLAWVA